MIADGSQVSLEYTLTTDDGKVADSNVGAEPLVYTHGGQQILPALEAALVGLAVGEEKTVSLSAEEGYGVGDPELIQTVPASTVPEDAHEVGTQLLAESSEGEQHMVRVKEVKGEEIVIDLNHPLAGESLHFAVKVLAVE